MILNFDPDRPPATEESRKRERERASLAAKFRRLSPSSQEWISNLIHSLTASEREERASHKEGA